MAIALSAMFVPEVWPAPYITGIGGGGGNKRLLLALQQSRDTDFSLTRVKQT